MTTKFARAGGGVGVDVEVDVEVALDVGVAVFVGVPVAVVAVVDRVGVFVGVPVGVRVGVRVSEWNSGAGPSSDGAMLAASVDRVEPDCHRRGAAEASDARATITSTMPSEWTRRR